MKQRILLSLIVFFSICANGWAQTVTCTKGSRTETFNISSLKAGQIVTGQYTDIIMTGGCNSDNIRQLISAIHTSNRNQFLETVDMGEATFVGANIDFSSAFQNCTKVISIILPSAGSSATINLANAFNGCTALSDIYNLEKLAKATNFSATFKRCEGITKITLPSEINTQSISFNETFDGCTSLSTITNLEKFTNVTNFGYAFNNCAMLNKVSFGAFISSVVLTDAFLGANTDCVKYMANDADKTTATTAGWTNVEVLLSATDVQSTTAGSWATKTSLLLGGEWNKAAIDKLIAAIHLNNANTALLTVDMSAVTLSADVTSIEGIFKSCAVLTSVTLPSAGSANDISFTMVFDGCTMLSTIINLDKFTKVTDFSSVFKDCTALKSLTLPRGTNAQDISFNSAFGGCTSLTTINNLGIFTNVKDFSLAFHNCAALTSISLPSRTSASEISFKDVFSGCKLLTTIYNLENFANVTDFSAAFADCIALTNVTLPSAGSSKNIPFVGTFSGCTMLTTINNLEKFTKVTSFSSAFNNCTALTKITFADFTQDIVLTNAFSGANTACIKYVANDTDKATATAAGWNNVKITPLTAADVLSTNAGSWSAKTSLLLGGEWNQIAIDKLIAAIHLSSANAALLTVDMADVTFNADVTKLNNVFNNCTALTSVILPSVGSANGISFSSAFNACTTLSTITNLEKFTNITDFSNAFVGCATLTNITLPHGTNASEISFNGAFSGCTVLATINNLEKFTKVTNFSSTFKNCTALTKVTFGTFTPSIVLTDAFSGANATCIKYVTNDTDKATATTAGWTNVKIVPLTAADVQSVTAGSWGTKTSLVLGDEWNQADIDKLIAAIHLNNANTALLTVDMADVTFNADVTKLNSIFNGCTALTSVILPSVGSANGISFSSTFNACTTLSTITNLEKFTNVTDFGYAFSGCNALASITLPNGTKSSGISFSGAFANCLTLATIDLSKFINTTSFNNTFRNCQLLANVTLPNGTSASEISFNNAFYDCKAIKIINLENFANIKDFSNAFYGCKELGEITLPYGTSALGISFNGMFNGCDKLATINNLNGFTNITDFSNAFNGCKMLTIIDLPSGTSAGNISFNNAFYDCIALTNIYNLEKFTTINNFNKTFMNCKALSSVNLPNGTNAPSISFSETFDGCAKLKTINNLKGFTNITDFYNAFWGCTELTSVTLPKGTSANSISFINAFNLCAALTTVDNLDLFTNVTSFSNVFWGCKALGEVNFGAFTQGIILTAAFGDANTSCVKYVASNEDKVTAEAAGWTNVYVRRATNIEKDSAASGLLFSTSADGKTVIESSKVRTISIFSINGQEIDKILLHEGANILDLEKGIYIIEGTKIAF